MLRINAFSFSWSSLKPIVAMYSNGLGYKVAILVEGECVALMVVYKISTLSVYPALQKGNAGTQL
jgi:Na+-transporting NADH:ubiquinone oxidoreductase subunit NqrD